MFYSTSDDDDGSGFAVGMPPSGSKLQSLFGAEQSHLKEGNESLMYVPPKQPKAKNETSQQQSAEQKLDGPALMYACACHTFRFVNGQYVNQGKLGLAVLGNFSTKDYKVLIYASQKKAVTSAKISPTFLFKVQKDNYASFYDDQSQNWSVRFDAEEQLFEVAKRVAISKFNITPGAVITQDLNFQSTQEVKKSDTVEVLYTGWLHDGNNIGKVFDSNEGTGKLLKFKVGKGKVIKGWNFGILGMKKLSRRVIIVPSDHAAESKIIVPNLPTNCALIFQIEVTRVKFANPQDSDTVSLPGQIGSETGSSNDDLRDIDVPNTTHESLSERTKSISEQLTKPENTKSKLLERMSKMGQAMVPPPNITNVSIEDDIDEDESAKLKSKPAEHMPETSKPQLKPKPDSPHTTIPLSEHVQVPLSQPNPPNVMYQQPTVDPATLYHAQQQQQQHLQQQQQQQQQLALYQAPHSVQAALFGYPSVPQMAVPQMASQPASISSTEMNLMLTDGRLKHTELKSDLNRIVDKIDTISSKINNLENTNKQLQISQSSTSQQIFSQAPEMEASVIMQNITRIIKENEKLRQECAEKTKKIELLNEKMTDLLTKNQSFFEKSNQLLANQTDSMQNSATQAMVKVSHLEEQNIRLQTELAALRSQLVQAHGQKDVISKNEGHLSNRIDSLSQELMHAKENAESANNLIVEKNAVIVSLEERLKNGKGEQKHLQLKFTQLQEENVELKTEKESLDKLFNDVKKKRKSEKEKYDEELEDLKSQHEEEIKSLRERYKKSSGKESEKIAKIEEELTQQYEEKIKTKVNSLERIHVESMNTVNEENDALKEDIKKVKDKLSTLASEHSKNISTEVEHVKEIMKNEHSHAIKELKERIESLLAQLKAVEEKASSNEQEDYAKLLQNFNEQAQEIERLKSDCDHSYDKGLKDGRSTVETISNASYQRGYSEGKAGADTAKPGGATPSVPSEKIAEEVKKVMNSVFFKTKTEFEVGKQYDGKHVINTLLNTIKEITLKMIAGASEASEEASEDSDVSEDEESDEEVVDDDDDEEESDEEVVNVEKKEEVMVSETKDIAEATTEDLTVQLNAETEESNKSEETQVQDELEAVQSISSSDEAVTATLFIEVLPQSEGIDSQLDINEDILEDPELPEDNVDKNTESLHPELAGNIDAELSVQIEPIIDNLIPSGLTEPPSDHVSEIMDHTMVDPTDNASPVVTESISSNIEEVTSETLDVVNDSIETFVSSEPLPELTSSISITDKSPLGDSGDEHYATDEGEDISDVATTQSENMTPSKIDSDLVSELLDVVENNQKVFQSEENVDEIVQHDNVKNIENSDHQGDPNESNEIPSSAIIAEDNLRNEQKDTNLIANEADLLVGNTDGKSDDLTESEPLNSIPEDPLMPAEIQSNTKPDSLDSTSKVIDKPVDELNSIPTETTAKKNNPLEDLGLDSSLFGVTKSDGDYVLPNNEDVKDNGIDGESESASVSSKETTKKETPTTEGSTSAIKSIFDDDDSDDDLFNSTNVKHKVSAFVRSPPPLFDDDDDDVNWI